MANIKTYDAPAFSLTESDKGGQAWSQAGRRLGPLYNEAAQFTREAGKLAADNKAQLWPFDILELYQRQAAAAAKAAGGGVRIRVANGGRATNDFPNERFPNLAQVDDETAAGNTQVSRGAGALGQALSDGGRAVSNRNPNALPPPGSSARARMMREAMAYGEALTGGGGPRMTLDQGALVPASGKAMEQYQMERDKAVAGWTQDAVNTRDYWTRYQGGDPAQTDQSGRASGVDQYGNPTSSPGAEQPPEAPSTSGFFDRMFSGWSAGSEASSEEVY